MKPQTLFQLLCLLFLGISCTDPIQENLDQAPTVQIEESINLNETSKPIPFNIGDNYIACGWVDCARLGQQYIDVNTNWTEHAHSGGSSIKVTFKPCEFNQGGMYWMNRQEDGICNWGDFPGNDLSSIGYTKLTVMLKGETGKEKIKILLGGAHTSSKPYSDYKEISKTIPLTQDWKKHTLEIPSKSMEGLINGFAWFATMADNPEGLVFYLDDIMLE